MNIPNLNSLRRYLTKTPIPISEISKSSKVSRTSIHRFINGGTLKKNTADKIIKTIQNVYNEHLVVHDDLNQTKEIDVNASYVIGLQKDTIDSLKDGLSILKERIEQLKNELKEMQKVKNLIDPDWEKIHYDVVTYQTYKENFSRFTNYEIVRYKLFYAKLGYNESEAEVLYKKHKKVMLNFDYEDEKFQHKRTESGDIVDIESLDWEGVVYNELDYKNSEASFTDHAKTVNFFKSSKQLGLSSCTTSHRIAYKHKDGSSVHAIVYVLYDITGKSSMSKIKFLNLD
jgi:gas vesicle protein